MTRLFNPGDVFVMDYMTPSRSGTAVRLSEMSERDGTTHQVLDVLYSDVHDQSQIVKTAILENGKDTKKRLFLSIQFGRIILAVSDSLRVSNKDTQRLFQSVGVTHSPKVSLLNRIAK